MTRGGAPCFHCGEAIPAGTVIGFDPESDRKRFHVSEGGVVVLPKGVEVPAP